MRPDSVKCEHYKPYNKGLHIIYRGVGIKENDLLPKESSWPTLHLLKCI